MWLTNVDHIHYIAGKEIFYKGMGMFKQITVGEVKVGDRVYRVLCDSQSPLGELHDALMQMKGHCVDMMIAAQKAEQELVEKQKALDEQIQPE